MTQIQRGVGRKRPTPMVWLAAIAGLALAGGLVAWAVIAANGAREPGQTATSGATETGSSQPSAHPGPSAPPVAPSASPAASGLPGASAAPSPLASVDPDPVVRETLAPAPLDDPVEPSPGVTVELRSIEAVTGVANIAGEIAGPALRITVEATNDGTADFDTPAVVVNLYTGDDRRPAGGIREPGGRDFPGVIPAGSSASGVFLFTVPEDEREHVLVEVDLQVGEPVVLFEGAVG